MQFVYYLPKKDYKCDIIKRSIAEIREGGNFRFHTGRERKAPSPWYCAGITHTMVPVGLEIFNYKIVILGLQCLSFCNKPLHECLFVIYIYMLYIVTVISLRDYYNFSSSTCTQVKSWSEMSDCLRFIDIR